MQISLAKVPPTTLIENQIKFNFIPVFNKMIYTRSKPYPPNFNKIPAIIIEPLTDLEACLFLYGCFRCVLWICFFYCFHCMPFPKDMLTEFGLTFCVSKIFGFFKSCGKVSVCSSYLIVYIFNTLLRRE
jgi:2-oxoglutarate dehydrogenase complex, dehydrogenase (E1) component, and related enzymes